MSLLEKYPYLKICLANIKRDIGATNLYLFDDEDYAPSAKQIKGARSVIACNDISSNDEIFWSQDMTLFSDGEIGCIATDKYLYYKDRWEYPIRMEYKGSHLYYGNGELHISDGKVTALSGSFPDDCRVKISLSANKIDAIYSVATFISAMIALYESENELSNDDLIEKATIINEERVRITDDTTALDRFFDKYISPYEKEIEQMLQKLGADGNIEFVIDKVIDIIPVPARYVVPRSFIKQIVVSMKNKMFN